ncbi:MAG: rhodanese-like domain-containing protein [Solirubrobacterales bacterium]
MVPEPELTVQQLLQEARSKLERLTASDASDAVRAGAILVDIRSELQRSRDGELPGAKWFPRNVLEWRLDPSSPDCDPDVARRDVQLIVVCNEGYQSSLAAATLQRFGLQATDLIGGFQAWRQAGLPVGSSPGERPR